MYYDPIDTIMVLMMLGIYIYMILFNTYNFLYIKVYAIRNYDKVILQAVLSDGEK